MADSSNEEFVVSGAMTHCDGSVDLSSKVTFIATDRAVYIGTKFIGTEVDTSPQDNFSGNYGRWKYLQNGQCIPHFLPTWFNPAKTVKYSKLNLLIKEYQNACKYAMTRATKFFMICENDFTNDIGLVFRHEELDFLFQNMRLVAMVLKEWCQCIMGICLFFLFKYTTTPKKAQQSTHFVTSNE